MTTQTQYYGEISWILDQIDISSNAKYLHMIFSPTTIFGSKHNTAFTLLLLEPNHQYGYNSEGIITESNGEKGRLGSLFSVFLFPSYTIFLVCRVADHA